MDIRTYREEQGLSQAEFAARFSPPLAPVSQGLVWQWESGRQRVTAERAIEIETATNGAVTRHDLRPDIFGPVPELANAA